jgi:hypothetical protein
MAFASIAGLALLIAVRQNSPTLTRASQTEPLMMAVALSNQNLAAYFSYPDGQESNLPNAGFKCNNLGESIGSSSLLQGVRSNR